MGNEKDVNKQDAGVVRAKSFNETARSEKNTILDSFKFKSILKDESVCLLNFKAESIALMWVQGK